MIVATIKFDRNFTKKIKVEDLANMNNKCTKLTRDKRLQALMG